MPVDEKNNGESKSQPHPTPAGQYYLMEKIAQGGMAEIFKGLSYDVHGIKKTVCIKKILPNIAASKEFIDSLIDEAKIAVTLSHGNIAQIYDLGKVGDDYFMVMEFVEGRSLSKINKRCLKLGKKVPIPITCYFIAEILNGLNYIHRRADENGRPLGIVHRDISPQNIVVSFSGTVKIIDFGIAKSEIKIGTTDSGILKGKFAYMSPEQARGDKIDHRSDIFSLGVIFHEMLTGQRLFKAEENRQTLRNVRRAKVKPPSETNPEIPPELDEIVMRSLKKDRRERYLFASEMHDDLVKFLYTTYPDFKPSDVEAFVIDLFKEDLPKPGEEKEAGTPYLIIDHTSSALIDRDQFEETGIAKAPIDVKEYVVGQMPKHETEEVTPPVIDIEEAKERDDTAKSAISEIESGVYEKKRKNIKIAVTTVIVAAFLIAAGWFWFSRPKPIQKTEGIQKGQILVTMTPPDSEVFVDGKEVGSGSPLTIQDIESGKPHVITVQKTGYVTQTVRFQLDENEFKDFSITLKPEILPVGTLSVTTTPTGATIFLDDQETKYKTPAKITDIDPSIKHTLGLHLPNYKFWTTSFSVGPNETQNFHIQLALDYGSLKVTTNPKEAIVLIDGKTVGQTPLIKEDLKPGNKYQIEVWLENYTPVKKEILINPGETEEVHLELERMESTKPNIEVETIPREDAQIKDNATPLGPATN